MNAQSSGERHDATCAGRPLQRTEVRMHSMRSSRSTMQFMGCVVSPHPRACMSRHHMRNSAMLV
ncbi:hypothetical protein WI26_21490 [Burkholderia diffusa]|nr:hypothetical protein WI26_21490 [Burkholderia diffusa]